MLFSLVKKDFILAKKYLIGMIIFAVLVPIGMTTTLKVGGVGFLNFFSTVILLEYMLFSSVSMAEDKYKGSALLCATSYTRNALVEAKYIFILILFIYTYIIYTITAIVTPFGIVKLNITMLGISFLGISICFGILMPIQYRFGYEKTKYISMAMIFILFFGGPYAAKGWNFSNIAVPFSQVIINLGIYALAIAIGYVSMILSINIYSKKNL